MFIGQGAPNFASLAIMPGSDDPVDFELVKHIRGKMALVFFYSMDFSYVCPTELIALQNRAEEFKKRDVVVVCISGDSYLSHLNWRKIPREKGGIAGFPFPMVADVNRSIAKGYNVLINDAMSLRASFVIDKIGVVRYAQLNDFHMGRNVDELLRAIDAQLHHEQTGALCPAQWQSGEPGIMPNDKSVQEFLTSYADQI